MKVESFVFLSGHSTHATSAVVKRVWRIDLFLPKTPKRQWIGRGKKNQKNKWIKWILFMFSHRKELIAVFSQPYCRTCSFNIISKEAMPVIRKCNCVRKATNGSPHCSTHTFGSSTIKIDTISFTIQLQALLSQ